MTAIEKMARVYVWERYKLACDVAHYELRIKDVEQTWATADEGLKKEAIFYAKEFVRALIDHIKETGAPEMVRVFRCESCGLACGSDEGRKRGLIAALEEVVK